jgi:hypothetical protein
MLELSTRVTYFYVDPVGFSADNEMILQKRRLALRLFFEQDRRSLDGVDCDGQTYNRAFLRLPVTTMGASARRVEGGARQRPAYVDVKDQSQADRDRREVGRAAVDRDARLLGRHGYGARALGFDDRQARCKEES